MTTPTQLREIAEYACFDSMTDSYRAPVTKHPAWEAADRIEALEAALRMAGDVLSRPEIYADHPVAEARIAIADALQGDQK